MIGETAIVTDSAAYLPRELVERYGVVVAPLSVEIDGKEYLEGIDITPDEFYEMIGSAGSVSTSQPSVGQLVEAYRRAAREGARDIVSLHISGTLSGTVQSARLAADSSPIPVRVIDTGQGSFAEGLCVWEALEALGAGRTVDEVESVVAAASRSMGNTFVVRALDLIKRGGRLVGDAPETEAGVPVMAYTGEGVQVVGNARLVEEAVEMMAGHVKESAAQHEGGRLRIGVGHGAAQEIAATLRERIAAMPFVEEIVDYVVGPAVGAHTGAGTAGAVFLPRPVQA